MSIRTYITLVFAMIFTLLFVCILQLAASNASR
nr:MAG TPA: hypothetical protein [Caudoviricetes sp.]